MHSIKATRLNSGNHRFDVKLEGLRGLCALNVVVAHIFSFNFFGAMHTPVFQAVMHIQFAHISVLIFFIISGYVMGISHINTTFSYSNVKSYLKKRAVRLYPIYILALLISICCNPLLVTLPQIIGHTFFLQDFLVEVIPANVVLWSLSYEIVYYILFIMLWALKHQSKSYYLLLGGCILCYVSVTPSYTVFKSVLIGWIFWLAGLYLARSSDSDNLAAINLKFKPLISYFLLLLSISNLNTGGLFMRLLHISIDHQKHIIYEDWFYLPICTLITATITGRSFRFIGWIKATAYALPSFSVFTLFYFRHDILSNIDWAFGIVYFGMAISLMWLNTDINIFQKLQYVGKISYAIYVFHFPVGFFLNIVLARYLSGLPLLFTGLILFLTIIWTLSFYTELQLQHYIRKLILPKKQPAITTILP